MHFKDRKDAGEKLAEALKQYRGENLVVYALPRGGVVLGEVVAEKLDAPLDLLITRKIGHPMDPEYAIAAISENGDLFTNDEELSGIDKNWFEQETLKQQAQAVRRRKLYSAGRKPIGAANKICIIVDDGLATGLTMKAAIKQLQRQKPKAIVVAVPVAPPRIVKEMLNLVSEVVVLYSPQEFGSIGYFYENFEQVTDEQVCSILDRMGKM